jgi:hypothetical protein
MKQSASLRSGEITTKLPLSAAFALKITRAIMRPCASKKQAAPG